MSNYIKKCVDCSLIKRESIEQELICTICLQFMTNPYRVNCGGNNGHVFGINCIKEWMRSNGKKECPLCRGVFDELNICFQLKEKVNAYQAECHGCKQTFQASILMAHSKSCEILRSVMQDRLKIIVDKQIECLQKEISPHLRKEHLEIYSEHVQDWKWLQNDGRDWKWWWWCKQPWWKNKSCEECNQLWHKYEKQMDQIQSKRIQLLKDLQFQQPQ